VCRQSEINWRCLYNSSRESSAADDSWPVLMKVIAEHIRYRFFIKKSAAK
jgi:hypothetical protein